MELAATDTTHSNTRTSGAKAADGEDWTVERVLVVFKTHLDIGFTDFAAVVRGKYMEQFIPNALETARLLRERGGAERLVWTAGSWLISEFLEHAAPDARRAMETAIGAGDIAWHAVPFTTHTEFLDRPLFEAGLAISARLDERFGLSTCAAKMTDVPGHTRAMVPLLARAGVGFLHIGVNPASTPPDVPGLFRWRDAETATHLTVMYNKGSYGDVSRVPGTGLALAVAHTGDNHGPQSPDEIIAVFDQLRRQFPAARVEAASLNDFARAIAAQGDGLPVVSSEIGDTWIYGAASDPQKAARFRALARLHRDWAAGVDDPPPAAQMAGFGRNLLLVAEHTWGLDEKTHLADFEVYAKPAFAASRPTERFAKMEKSWAEQRAYLDRAVETLGTGAARTKAHQALGATVAAPPDTAGLKIVNGHAVMSGPHARVAIGPAEGAVESFSVGDAAPLADRDHPLCLLSYMTFSPEQYRAFWRSYVVNKRITAPWSFPDFMKPGMEKCGARQTLVHPAARTIHAGRRGDACLAVVDAAMPAEAAAEFGAPRRVTIEYELPDDAPEMRVTVQWFDKDPSRLPEAVVLSFRPTLGAGPLRPWVDKLGARIDVRDVVRNGNRSMHAAESRAGIESGAASLTVETLDAPLVDFFGDSLVNFTNRIPTGRHGLHFVLHNNLWGTNFPMWNGEDAKFRFVIRWTARPAGRAARA